MPGPPPEAIVIRFPPGGPEDVKQVRKEAKYQHRQHQKIESVPWYRLSVWADVAQDQESEQDVLARLVEVAGLHGIRTDEERNALLWRTVVERITEAGFHLVKDGYPGEPSEHWSVDLGPDEPSSDVVARFVGVFDGPLGTRELGT